MKTIKALELLNLICDLGKKEEFVCSSLLIAPEEKIKPAVSIVGCKKDITFAQDRMIMNWKRS